MHKARRQKIEIQELIIEMKLLERRLTLYEEKYGVLSEDFYNALMSGEVADCDFYDETRADFNRWKGIYETWLRRKEAYADQIRQCDLAEALLVQPARIKTGKSLTIGTQRKPSLHARGEYSFRAMCIIKLYMLNKKYLKLLREETEDFNWEYDNNNNMWRSKAYSEYRPQFVRYRRTEGRPPSYYKRKISGYMKAINDRTGATLYGWADRAFSWKKCPAWVDEIMHDMQDAIKEHRETNGILLFPATYIDCEDELYHGRNEINIEGWEFLICVSRGWTQADVRDLLPIMEDWREWKKKEREEADVSIEVLQRNMERSRTEIEAEEKLPQDARRKKCIEEAEMSIAYYRRKIATLKELKESKNEETKYDKKCFDRDVRWFFLKEQIENRWRKQNKNYQEKEIYLEMASREKKGNEAHFKKAWKQHNIDQRKKGKKQKSESDYETFTFPDNIRKAVERLQNKITAVFP